MPATALIHQVLVLLSLSVLLTACQEPRQVSSGQGFPSGTGHAFIYAQAEGRVEKLLVVPGQMVKPGDALLELKPPRNQPVNTRRSGGSRETDFAHLISQLRRSMVGAPGQDEVIDVYLMALDVIAHNLANINTTAFKRLQVDFQEIPGQTDQELGLVQMGGAQLVGPLKKGHGAKAICTTRIFTAGMLRQTGQPLDVAIHGEGFFEVFLADGTTAYTRDGTFRRAADGRVTTADGLPLGSGFQAIPSGTTSVAINRDGAVVYSTSSGATSFQIQLRTFSNLAGLEAIGRNLYRETAASGSTEFGMPGRDGCGELVQGFLERSNVDVTEQLQELVRLQNAYDVYSTIAETERKLSLQLTKTLQANSVMHQ